MYLDKLKDSFGFMGINKDESIGNISDTYKNVNVSLMNMDPFIWDSKVEITSNYDIYLELLFLQK